MKVTIGSLILFLCIFCLQPSPLLPQEKPAKSSESETQQMLWEHLMRRSEIWFTQVIAKKGGEVSPGEWKEPVERALARISSAAGCAQQGTLKYAIVKDGDFNAGCLAGGQVFICKGTLDLLDQLIEKSGKSEAAPETKSATRENLIAPILAHEYGHFINKHQYREILRQWSSFKQDEEGLPQMKYSQEDELDADATGVFLLQKAGYDSSVMEITLQILNILAQNDDTVNTIPVISYTQTHPSPHARLAALKGKNAGMHAWAAKMERAFDDVQIGKNLNAASKILADTCTAYPSNAFFHKVYAAALHKLWLSTVPLPAQGLRAIISVPSFRDSMIAPSGSMTRGGGQKTIPGDIRLYQAARSEYARAAEISKDPELLSNYAVLLCYSPSKEDEARACHLAEKAFSDKTSVSSASNMVVVLYMTGQKRTAYEYSAKLAESLHSRYTEVLEKTASSEEDREKAALLFRKIGELQRFDDTYMYADFTPILNYALITADLKSDAAAKPIADNLLTNYDDSSAWAVYLAHKLSITIERPAAKKPALVDGISVGSSMDALLRTWGKPDEIGTDDGGNENWLYRTKKTIFQVESGTIMQITLLPEGSPSLKNIHVGSLKSEIEASLGKETRSKNPYYLYDSLEQRVIVQYLNETAIRIDIVP